MVIWWWCPSVMLVMVAVGDDNVHGNGGKEVSGGRDSSGFDIGF